MNFQKAVEFVRRNGDEVELTRLKYLLANDPPQQRVITQLFTGQQPDGGWSPLWARDYSSLDATCFRLAQAEQMGLSGSERAVKRAVHFLVQRQHPDGSWEEDQKVADLAPPWAKPGDLSARLYLTANCALWLALLGDFDKKASKAADYLEMHQDHSGHLPGFLHTHWLAGGLWYRLMRQTPAERAFEYLGMRINDLAASNLSWLITTFSAAGVPPDNSLVNTAASLLEQSQQDDGRWLSEDGPTQEVHATVEALRALGICGRFPKP
jgi:hypothetical protein